MIVASKGGNPQHPGWYVNLREHPEVQVQIRGDKFAARARDATPDERPELWKQMTEIWPDYDNYQAAHRPRDPGRDPRADLAQHARRASRLGGTRVGSDPIQCRA